MTPDWTTTLSTNIMRNYEGILEIRFTGFAKKNSDSSELLITIKSEFLLFVQLIN